MYTYKNRETEFHAKSESMNRAAQYWPMLQVITIHLLYIIVYIYIIRVVKYFVFF